MWKGAVHDGVRRLAITRRLAFSETPGTTHAGSESGCLTVASLARPLPCSARRSVCGLLSIDFRTVSLRVDDGQFCILSEFIPGLSWKDHSYPRCTILFSHLCLQTIGILAGRRPIFSTSNFVARLWLDYFYFLNSISLADGLPWGGPAGGREFSTASGNC
ncbi:hypothetical protein EJ04DRAFT_177235 [Polyplosphaeria fusca]|uniref:Uncharacterized protein n=1 Tax=Polyplosphaeria fusca TaxID=682080 RepID=A0A9P4R040_9PLEO|nr:hypothetical protein EJ04DRAFT_177235 [Polyplosphaeria fusca]